MCGGLRLLPPYDCCLTEPDRISSPATVARAASAGESMGTANFGIVGLDWQQRVNWDRMKKYRTERAREHMKKHGLGAVPVHV